MKATSEKIAAELIAQEEEEKAKKEKKKVCLDAWRKVCP